MKLSAAGISRWTILSILLILTAVSSNLNFGKNRWAGVMEADAKGYYAYLPAIFIYHDLNFGFFDQIDKGKYHNPMRFYDYRAHAGKILINKYYCGTAIAQLPLFLAAHVICPVTGHDRDGYSKPYMLAIYFSALLFLLIGLIYTNRFLALYGISDLNRALALICVVFATNLFYYTVVEAGMSHVYSFGWISIFLYRVKKFFMTGRVTLLPLTAALFAIIVLTRPVNGLLIAAIPFLASNKTNLLEKLRELTGHTFIILMSAMIAGSILFLQPVIYKVSTGSFFIYSYEYETFRFLDPHFTDMLFSYKKGLFLYTPFYLLSLAGLIYLYRSNRFESLTLAGFFILLNYVLSSWWNWWYGGSFSQRVYIEFLPLFGLLFATAAGELKKYGRKLYLSCALLLIVICQIQTYQYRYYQIHWENMDAEKYWKVFLRIDQIT